LVHVAVGPFVHSFGPSAFLPPFAPPLATPLVDKRWKLLPLWTVRDVPPPGAGYSIIEGDALDAAADAVRSVVDDKPRWWLSKDVEERALEELRLEAARKRVDPAAAAAPSIWAWRHVDDCGAELARFRDRFVMLLEQ